MISIIIPVYNGEKYIKRCLDSVILQTYSDIEIVIVNDGSTDNTLKICEDYKHKDSRIKIINKSNGGQSSARNSGLQAINGEYIIFVDADDYIDKDACKIITQNIEDNIDLYIYDNFLINKQGMINCINYGHYPNINYLVLDAIEPFNDSKSTILRSAWAKVYKKEIIEKIRFNEKTNIWEDLEYFITTIENIGDIDRIRFVEGAWYYYDKRNNDSITNKINNNLFSILCDELLYIKSIVNKMNNVDIKIINTVLCKFCWHNFWILYYQDQYKIDSFDCIKWYEYTKELILEKNITRFSLKDANSNRYFVFRYLLNNKLFCSLFLNILLRRNRKFKHK